MPDLLDGVYALAKVCSPFGVYSHSLPAIAGIAAIAVIAATPTLPSQRIAGPSTMCWAAARFRSAAARSNFASHQSVPIIAMSRTAKKSSTTSRPSTGSPELGGECSAEEASAHYQECQQPRKLVRTIRPEHRVERSKGEKKRPDFAGRVFDAFAQERGAFWRQHGDKLSTASEFASPFHRTPDDDEAPARAPRQIRS